MDINELKAKYPDLVQQIVNEATEAAQAGNDGAVQDAVNAERNRIREIDSISQTIGADLVNEAKYGEKPCTASELALRALQEQQAQGTSFLQNRQAEQQAAGVNNVAASPVGGSEEDTTEKDIADGAALITAKFRK